VTTIIDLHNAVRALRPDGINHHAGQAPGEPDAPWLVTSFERQETEISEASLPVAFTDALTVTIAALTEDQANYWLDEACRAFTGATLTADGWQIGALQPPSVRGPYAAGLTALDTNLRYQVVRATWRFTASRTA
jgi:hypothetical protein